MNIKIGALFLLVFFVQQAGSQNNRLSSSLEREITLEVVNMPVSKILKQLEEQTRLHFSYNSEITKGLKPVTASFRSKKITEIISLLFDDKIKCKIKNNYVILSPNNKILPANASKHPSGNKSDIEKSGSKKQISNDTLVSLKPSKNNSDTAAHHPANHSALTSPGKADGNIKTDSLSALPQQLFLINNDTTLLLQEEDTSVAPK